MVITMFETYSDSVRKRYIISNRIIQIKDNKETTVASYDYYKNDNIKSVTVGNGIKTDYKYDGDGNVESLITVTSTGEVLVDFNYAYDLNGNRLQKVSTKHQNFYQYDSMNRLKDSSYDGRKESFTYDKVGNRLSKTTNDITERYVYNARNQLKELHKKDNKTNFTYDKQGNTIKEESNLGINSFEYNTLNQQVKVITNEGNTLVSRYDAEGLRCEIEENEKLTRFIFHKENILVETDKDNTPISRFARGYEVVVADITGGSEENRYYYTQDEQGSTVFITDSNHQIRNEYYYDAFGNVLDGREEVPNRITYTGQQFDNITQQYYLRARFYNPIIGRFTQEDVYRGDGLNLYAYCKCNPVSYYDPSGYKNRECPPSKNKALNSTERAGEASGEYRSASLRGIKRQLDVPMSQQPISQKMVPLTDSNGNWILNVNKQPVMTRELTYDVNGKKIVIQDHSAGHDFGEGGIGDQPSHHNVRPAENTRTGKVEGMEDHYYFDKRNNK